MVKVKDHFRSWDRREIGTRTKSGSGGHHPDDLAMAAWVGYVKAHELLTGNRRGMLPKRPVPETVRRRWARFQRTRGKAPVRNGDVPRQTTPTIDELVTIAAGNTDDYDD
jgi:hypothetical protein